MVDVRRSGLIGGRDGSGGRHGCGSGGTTKPQRGTSPLGEEMAENALIELVVAMLQTAYAPEVPVAFGQRSSLASRDRAITEVGGSAGRGGGRGPTGRRRVVSL
jgi:hypothetical protein